MAEAAATTTKPTGYVRAQGTHYLDLLGALHRTLKPSWYLEVGTNTGHSLVKSNARSVAVDPNFVLKTDPAGNRPVTHFFQMTSDAFFQTGFLEKNEIVPDFAFLDGMHLFEFLLRDFMNTEKRAKPTTTVALHDCCPWNARMALRDRETQAWTGDVWKTLVILLRERPDLSIKVYDAKPTGLVVIEGLDPTNTVLDDKYDALLAEFQGMGLDAFGAEAFYGLFDYHSTDAYLRSGQ